MRNALTLTKETLAELTADDLAAVAGGNHSESCSCTVTNGFTTEFTDHDLVVVPTLDLAVRLPWCGGVS